MDFFFFRVKWDENEIDLEGSFNGRKETARNENAYGWAITSQKLTVGKYQRFYSNKNQV